MKTFRMTGQEEILRSTVIQGPDKMSAFFNFV